MRAMSVISLEVATPTRRPFSGRRCHALTWRSHGHSLLAAYLSRHLRDLNVLRCTPDTDKSIAAAALKGAASGRGNF